MTDERWISGALGHMSIYIRSGVIVGTVVPHMDSDDWHAYGCLNQWQDVDLGVFEHGRMAYEAVMRWADAQPARKARSIGASV